MNSYFCYCVLFGLFRKLIFLIVSYLTLFGPHLNSIWCHLIPVGWNFYDWKSMEFMKFLWCRMMRVACGFPASCLRIALQTNGSFLLNGAIWLRIEASRALSNNPASTAYLDPNLELFYRFWSEFGFCSFTRGLSLFFLSRHNDHPKFGRNLWMLLWFQCSQTRNSDDIWLMPFDSFPFCLH